MPCIYAHLASSEDTELLSWLARTTVVRADRGELASLLEQRRLSTTDRNGEYHMPAQIAGPRRIGGVAADAAPTQALMRPAAGRRPVVAALIPAWNEEKFIAATIEGLGRQTRPPDLIVVIANNCTDDTAAAARAAGAR